MFNNTLECRTSFCVMQEESGASPSKIISNKVGFPRPIFCGGRWSKPTSLNMKPIDDSNKIRASETSLKS